MSSLAVIIGIDDYTFAPLTSAVNDALAVRDALVGLGLVDAQEVVLLTEPVQGGGGRATRSCINAALKQVYDQGSRYDRLYFFFAGHGVSGYVDAAHSVTQTLLVPSDITDLAADANLLINFDDLRQRLEHAGPSQQFLFFDACRDLAFAEHPANLPTMGWPASAQPATSNVAQSTLFAVSPGGKALGLSEGLGVMTQHLIDAFHGRGLALDWSDDDGYVVTAQSIARHVRARIEAAATGHLQWRHQVMVPEPRDVGGPFAPIRVVSDPPPVSLTLAYEPPDEHGATKVTLMLRGQTVATPQWPPTQPLQPALAGPHAYRVCPTNPKAQVYADPERVDLREQQSAVIRLGSAPFERGGPAQEPAPGTAEVLSAAPDATRGLVGGLARVRTDAGEPGTVIELIGTDPPYDRQEHTRLINEEVPPGSYLMRFRQGTEVYSEVVLDLVAGESVHVRPGGARSPLLSEAHVPDHDGSVYVSSTAGYVRSGTLSTVLTLLGIVPFDPAGTLHTQFQTLVPKDRPGRYGERPVRVVIAIEGAGWPDPVHEIAEQLRCELIDAEGDAAPMVLAPIAAGEDGWARIVHGTARAPGRSFTVRVTSRWTGTIEIASTALARRVTVLALTLTSDGRVELVQHVLRIPRRKYEERIPRIGYDRFLRELVLGQRLYASGELLQQASQGQGSSDKDLLATLDDLLYAKWTDPVLGCMAYLALAERAARGLTDRLSIANLGGIAATNLYDYFGDLPDARVIAAHAGVSGAPPLTEALDPGEMPVLAQTLRLIAAVPGPHQDDYRRSLRFISPTSPWTLAWRPEPDATPLSRVADTIS